MLSPTYKECSDAAGGPLQPGDVGTVVQDDGSSKPYRVKTEDGRAWWYTPPALVLTTVTVTPGVSLVAIGPSV